MIRWRDVFQAASILVALLAGSVAEPAAQPPGDVQRGERAPFPPPAFGRPPFEPHVLGLPYQATSVAEFVRNGEDGNVGARRTSGLVARDAAGRTRREDAIGPGSDHVVAIDDPVAGVHYVLFPERAEGRKFSEPLGERRPGRMVRRFHGPRGEGGTPAVETQSLGTEVIAGVEAEGTRETITLPAGLHGSESPVEIVSERWYSAELKAVVRHRRRDPRGERTWTLTDITRGEPEAFLFEVPGGIEIEEGIR